jgi:hypothetical protein
MEAENVSDTLDLDSKLTELVAEDIIVLAAMKAPSLGYNAV